MAHRADLGLAFDGDADRVIAVDHAGTVVDGDVLLALFALDLAERGHLAGNTVAVTVMTNLGFRLAMEARGIAVRETDVGDRHVLAALDADGLGLGGEQSGHIIFRARLDDRRRHPDRPGAGRPGGARRAARWPTCRPGWSSGCPSASSTCRSPSPSAWPTAPRSGRRWSKAEAELGHEGRVLLRPSGTEPLVRVMVEARVEAQADAVAAQLAGVVEAALGQSRASRPPR